jgi:hypothetical protein
MASFTWTGGLDINGANNWTTPGNWLVGGVAATTFPNSPADDVTVNSDVNADDAIISNGSAINVASLAIGNTAGVAGGHVIVGGSSAIGGGGGGSLTSAGAITVSSTNSGGGLVGGIGGITTAPTMTLTGPGVVIGGGGIFNIGTIINNGMIQADGGIFGLGALVLSSTTIAGTGFIEVDGPSALELNAPTAETIRVASSRGATAQVFLDQPTTFTGGLDVLNANTTVDLFLKNQSATGATFNAAAHTLVITGANGAVLESIPFTASGTATFTALPSAVAGYSEIEIAPSTPAIIPGIPAPVGGVSTTTLSSSELSAVLQGDQSAMRFVSGTEAITLVDGTLSVGPDTNQAFLARLYESLLGRAPDLNGVSAWNAFLNNGSSPAVIAQSFINSPEFQAKNPGQDNPGFVAALYRSFLGRAPEPVGLASWVATLDAGASKGDVTVAFANTPESKQVWSGVTSAGIFAYNPNSAIVRSEYLTGLGRDAESGGLAAWTNLVNNGASPTQLGESLAVTPEFLAQHGAQSNTDFINTLYQNGLGRAPDAGGLGFWTNALQGGTSRGGLVSAIATTPEALGHVQWQLAA